MPFTLDSIFIIIIIILLKYFPVTDSNRLYSYIKFVLNCFLKHKGIQKSTTLKDQDSLKRHMHKPFGHGEKLLCDTQILTKMNVASWAKSVISVLSSIARENAKNVSDFL